MASNALLYFTLKVNTGVINFFMALIILLFRANVKKMFALRRILNQTSNHFTDVVTWDHQGN